MSSELPIDDMPSGLGLVPIADEWVQGPGEPFVDPAGTALCFIQALQDPSAYRQALTNLTTPESREAWGDFSSAAALFAEIANAGLATPGQRPVPDVAYVAVMRDVETALYVDGGVMVQSPAVVSLVDRPDLGGWLVHAFDAAFVLPEDMPRSHGV
jgi:hypothetical protein